MGLESRWKATFFQLALFRNPWQQVSNLRFLSFPWCWGRKNQVKCLQTKEHSTDIELHSKPTRSPYDLVLFRRSRFVAHLNELSHRHGTSAPPRDESSAIELALKSAGNAHEERVVSYLENLLSTNAYRIPFAHPDRYALTVEAIRRREPIVVGAALHDDTFAGYADVLMLSSLDPFLTDMQRASVDPNAYIVCEIKLSSFNTIDFVLQIAAYTSMLSHIHRTLNIKHPSHAYLWLGSPENPPIRLDYRDLKYFFKRMKNEFLIFTRNFDENDPLPEPDAPLQMLSPWKTFAAETLNEADSLHLIAGIRQSQVQKISSVCGVSTLREFAVMEPDDLNNLVQQGELSTAYIRLQQQARIQHESRMKGSICYRRVFEHGQFMPESSEEDMFFDIEGYPLLEHGLEYLFGVSTRGNGSFQSWWSHTRAEEEQSFIQLVSWMYSRVEEKKRSGGTLPHVFHYGHYEISALRRIAMRAKTVQGLEAAVKLESLLESHVFVDVYKFIKSELLIGDSSYSIKSVEKIVGVAREQDELADAQSSVAMYHEWRMTSFSETQSNANTNACHPILQEICEYNEQDCKSLVLVVDWLTREFQSGGVECRDSVDKSQNVSINDDGEAERGLVLPGSCGRTLSQRQEDSMTIERSEELSHFLIHEKSDVLNFTARQTLYHLLGFYVRESSPSRQAFRDRIEAAASGRFSELQDDDKCITGLKLLDTCSNGDDRKKIVLRYSFSKQQYIGLSDGESVAFVTRSSALANDATEPDPIHKFMTILGCERLKGENLGIVSLGSKNEEGYTPPKYGSIVSSDELKICDAPLRKSILRKAEKLFGGSDKCVSVSLSSAFLNRRRLDENSEESSLHNLREKHAQSEKIAAFLASRDVSGVFVIQGPPGSGKTSLSASIIHNLIEEHNKTVAVSSNSHAAIDNLLRSAVGLGLDYSNVCKIGTKCSEDQRIPFKGNLRDLQVVPISGRDESSRDHASRKSSTSPKCSPRRRRRSAALVGATCYQLCREDSEGLFDFLFVDEASQVPVANFLAMASSAKHAVLVGDQQQLEMPIKGAHPGESGKSCLSYIVGEGVATVPLSRGLFLERSYRMAPSLCKFVSNTFYDGALSPARICESNKLLLERTEDIALGSGAGIVYLSCDSEYDSEREGPAMGKLHQPAEVNTIAKLIDRLVGLDFTVHSKTRELSAQDILVVAPYNIQVRALLQRLSSQIRVGTVDKFQGQQAPIVVISLCTGNPKRMHGNVEGDNLFSLSKNPVPFSVEGSSLPTERRRKGLHFTLQKNRLNVAISRAQCLAIIVGYSNPFVNMPITNLDDVALLGLFEQLREEGGQFNINL